MTMTTMEPTQKLSIPNKLTSGRRTANTTPPANTPTAIFVRTYATREIAERTVLAVGENRLSRNSGIVKTFDRM